jgi:hypothetical protein
MIGTIAASLSLAWMAYSHGVVLWWMFLLAALIQVFFLFLLVSVVRASDAFLKQHR